MDLEIVNPLEIPHWDDLILSHPEGTIFHSSRWARVLYESYGYEPVYFASFEGGTLKALFPCMDVRVVLTGRRGVSLPFTDYCTPIVPRGVDPQHAFAALIQYGVTAGWRYIETRSDGAEPAGASPWRTYLRHTLDLGGAEQTLRSNLRGSTWRNIKKAEKGDVKVTMETSIDALRDFYRLHGLTRKLHGLPPQPFLFFKKLHEHLLSNGLGAIALGSYKGEVVAGAVYLKFGDRMVYKYGASDRRYQHLRANNLVMWEAIRWHMRKGCRSLCLGRTEPENEGLLQFKRGWGGVEEKLCYYRYDLRQLAFVKEMRRPSGFLNRVARTMPLPMLRLAGKFLYRQMA